MDVPAVTVPIDTYNHERPASQTQFVVGCGPHMFQREGDSYCTAGSKEANSSRARCHRTSTRALSVGQLTPVANIPPHTYLGPCRLCTLAWQTSHRVIRFSKESSPSALRKCR